MPTESKLGIVLGLGLLIFSAVTVARPGSTVGSGPLRPVNSSSYSNDYSAPTNEAAAYRR